MVKVNLKEYARMLSDGTNSNKYEWEQMGAEKYRLLMKKGTIVLEKGNITPASYLTISFYNTTALIYSSTIRGGNPLYDDYLELMNTIISKNNEKINSEITDLFS